MEENKIFLPSSSFSSSFSLSFFFYFFKRGRKKLTSQEEIYLISVTETKKSCLITWGKKKERKRKRENKRSFGIWSSDHETNFFSSYDYQEVRWYWSSWSLNWFTLSLSLFISFFIFILLFISFRWKWW